MRCQWSLQKNGELSCMNRKWGCINSNTTKKDNTVLYVGHMLNVSSPLSIRLSSRIQLHTACSVKPRAYFQSITASQTYHTGQSFILWVACRGMLHVIKWQNYYFKIENKLGNSFKGRKKKRNCCLHTLVTRNSCLTFANLIQQLFLN